MLCPSASTEEVMTSWSYCRDCKMSSRDGALTCVKAYLHMLIKMVSFFASAGITFTWCADSTCKLWGFGVRGKSCLWLKLREGRNEMRREGEIEREREGENNLALCDLMITPGKREVTWGSVLVFEYPPSLKELYSNTILFKCCFLPNPLLCGMLGFPGSSDHKESASSAGDQGSIPRPGRSPGEGNGCSILACRIPWTEDSGRLQSMRSQRVGRNRATNTFTLSNTWMEANIPEKNKSLIQGPQPRRPGLP